MDSQMRRVAICCLCVYVVITAIMVKTCKHHITAHARQDKRQDRERCILPLFGGEVVGCVTFLVIRRGFQVKPQR